jgi:hypothetical protein
MPASGFTGIWTNTPNKTDHSTKGYTSKILLNYQLTGPNIEITIGQEIIHTLIEANLNIKGTNILPGTYFKKADGRCFRISMYYLKQYDGEQVNLIQQLLDISSSVTYDFNTEYPGDISGAGGQALVKYECYLSVFYDVNNSQYVAQANGNIVYAAEPDGSNVVMLQMSAYNIIDGASEFEIKIKNANNGSIYPVSLMIEEIS